MGKVALYFLYWCFCWHRETARNLPVSEDAPCDLEPSQKSICTRRSGPTFIGSRKEQITMSRPLVSEAVSPFGRFGHAIKTKPMCCLVCFFFFCWGGRRFGHSVETQQIDKHRIAVYRLTSRLAATQPPKDSNILLDTKTVQAQQILSAYIYFLDSPGTPQTLPTLPAGHHPFSPIWAERSRTSGKETQLASCVTPKMQRIGCPCPLKLEQSLKKNMQQSPHLCFLDSPKVDTIKRQLSGFKKQHVKEKNPVTSTIPSAPLAPILAPLGSDRIRSWRGEAQRAWSHRRACSPRRPRPGAGGSSAPRC